MCTVVFYADSAMSCGDAENRPVGCVCVRYENAIREDIDARYDDWLELALETRREEVTDMTLEQVAMIAVEANDRAKSNTHRLDEMQHERSELNRNINRMATAVEVLAVEQRHQTEAQREAAKKIENIEAKVEAAELAPAKEAKDIKKEVIKAAIQVLVGAVLGALLALLTKGAL